MRVNTDPSKAGVLVLLVANGVLAGCAGAPPALQGGPFADIAPKFAHQDSVGKRVRWGGRITASHIREHESCFEVAAAELDSTARPWGDNATQGTFFVCLSGFYDPAVYQTGRLVTVTGTVRAFETVESGNASGSRPKVEGESIYLWPRLSPHREWNPGWWRDPFWDDNPRMSR